MKNNRNTDYHDFLSNPSLNSFTFQNISDETIINMIDKLNEIQLGDDKLNTVTTFKYCITRIFRVEEIFAICIREFGFCANFSSREIHIAWNFAKFSSREFFFPRIFPPCEN